MYIGKRDLEFLIHLENRLGEFENWSDDVKQLWELNERLINERERLNSKTREIIAERRRHDVNYGRSKTEIANREKAKLRREQRNDNK
jgi:hypothetical protein